MVSTEPLLDNPGDLARLEYGRLLWKNPRDRAVLLAHWTDPRHPYCDRFARHRQIIEPVLAADPTEDVRLDADLRKAGQSLRTVMREIPPVFGQFFPGFHAAEKPLPF